MIDTNSPKNMLKYSTINRKSKQLVNNKKINKIKSQNA